MVIQELISSSLLIVSPHCFVSSSIFACLLQKMYRELPGNVFRRTLLDAMLAKRQQASPEVTKHLISYNTVSKN